VQRNTARAERVAARACEMRRDGLISNAARQRPFAVDLAIDDRAEGGIEGIEDARPHALVRDRDPRRRDDRVARLRMPQYADHVCEEAEHASRPLELLQCRPILRQALEQLRVDRIGEPQKLLVPLLLGLGRELGRVLAVHVRERLHRRRCR
jgi:hypothetical protein